MSKLRFVATVLAVVPFTGLVASCESGGRGGGPFDLSGLTGDERIRYRCDGDRGFLVTYEQDGDQATVDAGDVSYRLDLDDRDGRRRAYSARNVTLTVNGDEARLGIQGTRTMSMARAT